MQNNKEETEELAQTLPESFPPVDEIKEYEEKQEEEEAGLMEAELMEAELAEPVKYKFEIPLSVKKKYHAYQMERYGHYFKFHRGKLKEISDEITRLRKSYRKII